MRRGLMAVLTLTGGKGEAGRKARFFAPNQGTADLPRPYEVMIAGQSGGVYAIKLAVFFLFLAAQV